MRKIIICLLAVVMLAGCGGKTAESASSTTAEESKQAASVDDKYSVTEEEVKACLIGQRLKSVHKSVFTNKVEEHNYTDNVFIITEITELTYTSGKGMGDNNIKVSGTFQALGSMFKSSEPLPSSESTVNPVDFSIELNTDNKRLSHNFETTDAVLIKPVEPLDKENLIAYLDAGRRSEYSPSEDYFVIGPSETEGINIIGDIDYTNPNLRIVVIDDPFPDDEIFNRVFTIELYDGDEYLCTGNADADIRGDERNVRLDDLKKLR